MISLYRKELQGYFGTPFGFVFLGVFMLVSGIMFTTFNLLGANGSLAGTFDLLKNFSFILFPTLTMRMFAEERRTGAEPLLFTSRLGPTAIVLAKYFAAVTVFLSAMVATLVYVIIIVIYGDITAGSLVASYLGFILLGLAMTSICTFTSSFSENQITAAVASFGALFFLTLLASFTRSLQIPVITSVLKAIAITVRYDEFVRGIVSFGPVSYYLAITCLCLLWTVKILELRRWR
jgi:ABC-2 type transport system permease protein